MKQFLKDSPLLGDEFFKARPERLSVEDFIKLTQWVEAHQKEKDA